jgi:hypothetical protein
MHRHRDLAVADLAQSPRVLPGHTWRSVPVLDETRIVQDPSQRIQQLNHPLRDPPPDPDIIPGRGRHELLQDADDPPEAAPPSAASTYAAPAASTLADTSLNGTYAFTITPEQTRRAGVTDQGVIDENTGDIVWTFEDDAWKLDQVYATGPKAGTKGYTSGGYTLSDGHLKVFWTHDPGGWTEADVNVQADGSVSFRNIHDGGDQQAQALSMAWFTTWKRTG